MTRPGHCRDCRRLLLADGKCPQKCEDYRKPSRGPQRAAKASRERLKHVAAVERVIGIRPEDIKPIGPHEWHDITRAGTKATTRRSCPRCGSLTFVPATNRSAGVCADCGPIESVGL